MLSLLKRKSDAAPAQAPAWHPNFRNFERLPDTKVVRTAFFVNGAAIVIALLVVLWFAYQTFQLHALDRSINDMQRQIDRDRAGSGKTIAQYKKFQAESARLQEVDAFIKSKPQISELLVRLAQTLPANVALDAFQFQGYVVSVRGAVRGAPDQASGYVSTYLQQLRNDPVIGPAFEEITLVDLSRSPATGRLALEISMKLKGAKDAKKR